MACVCDSCLHSVHLTIKKGQDILDVLPQPMKGTISPTKVYTNLIGCARLAVRYSTLKKQLYSCKKYCTEQTAKIYKVI